MDIGGRDKDRFHIIDLVGKIDRLKDSIILKSYVNTLLEKVSARSNESGTGNLS